MAENWAVDAPEMTETEAGTVSLVLLELSVTELEEETAAESVTVQVVVPAPVTVVGLQANDDTVGGGGRTVTVAPNPLMAKDAPSPVEPFALATPIEAVVGVVSVRDATTPSGIAVVFIP